jgi:hypothetical protein
MLAIVLERARVPFFIFLDELDLLVNQSRDDEGRETFRSLLLTLLEDLPQYAFVVIAALEDSYDGMDSTVRSRVRSFKLSNLDVSQADKLLDTYVRVASAGRLEDILEDKPTALDIMVRSSGGNPRKLLSLAHFGYKRAQLSGRSAVSAPDLAEAQTDLNQLRSQDLKATVAKLLDGLHLSFAQDVRVGSAAVPLDIDFVVPDSVTPELAIYFLGAAYLQSEALKSINSLVARTRARELWPSLRAEILVVDGYVSRDVGSVLLTYFKYIVYFDPESFESRMRQYLRSFAAGTDKRGLSDSPTQRKEDVGTLRREFGRRQSREESFTSDPQSTGTPETVLGDSSGRPLFLQNFLFNYFGLWIRPLLARQLSLILAITLFAILIWGGFEAYARVIKPQAILRDQAEQVARLETIQSKWAEKLAKLSQTLNDISPEKLRVLDDLAIQIEKITDLQVHCIPAPDGKIPSIASLPTAKDLALFLSQNLQLKKSDLSLLKKQFDASQKTFEEFGDALSSMKSTHAAHDVAAFETIRGQESSLERDLNQQLNLLDQNISALASLYSVQWQFFDRYKNSISSSQAAWRKLCGLSSVSK